MEMENYGISKAYFATLERVNQKVKALIYSLIWVSWGLACHVWHVGDHFFFLMFLLEGTTISILYMTLFASGYCTRMHSELQFICLLGLNMESFFSSVLFALGTAKCSCKFVVMVCYSSWKREVVPFGGCESDLWSSLNFVLIIRAYILFFWLPNLIFRYGVSKQDEAFNAELCDIYCQWVRWYDLVVHIWGVMKSITNFMWELFVSEMCYDMNLV